MTHVPGDPPPRVAYAVSRKVGSAVARNRVRRRLREFARRGDLPGGAWLISASPGAADLDFRALGAFFEDAVGALR